MKKLLLSFSVVMLVSSGLMGSLAFAADGVLIAETSATVSQEKLLEIVRFALQKHKWKVKGVADNSVRARMDHRQLNSDIVITVAESSVSYSEKTSNKVKRKPPHKGYKLEAGELPESWLEALRNDVKQVLLTLPSQSVSGPRLSDDNKASIMEKFKLLKKLLEQELITKDEYGAKKAELLKSL
ncbi:MAG: hypothetical protein ACI93R_002604 [Flavobacteriales bacterium]|jgi:hypothetical protein